MALQWRSNISIQYRFESFFLFCYLTKYLSSIVSYHSSSIETVITMTTDDVWNQINDVISEIIDDINNTTDHESTLTIIGEQTLRFVVTSKIDGDKLIWVDVIGEASGIGVTIKIMNDHTDSMIGWFKNNEELLEELDKYVSWNALQEFK